MESIGDRLRKKREELNLSIDKVNRDTLIHPKIILALESDRASDFLSPVYIKNFIAKYAKFLGLNDKELVEEYINSHKDAPDTFFGKQIPMTKEMQRRAISYVVAVVVILIFLGLTVGLFLVISKGFFNKRRQVAKVVSLKETPAKPSIKQKPSEPAKVAKIKGPFRLTIISKEDSWVEIRCDGKIIFQGILPKGNMKKIDAKEKVELVLGSAKAVRLDLDGTPIVFNKDGMVRNMIITKAGIMKK